MDTPTTNASVQAFKELVRHYETVAAVAQEFEISVHAVYKWRKSGIPIEHCVTAEINSNKKLTRKVLRPLDWHKYWPELK